MSATIRSYTADDAPGVAAFLTAAAAADATLEPITVEQWRAFAAMSFNHGATDFAVADDGVRFVAVLMSCLEEQHGRRVRNFRIIVGPAHRRRGLGAQFLRVVDRQDADRATILQASTMGAWAAGARFLEQAGFRVERRLLWMSIETTPAASDVPEGVALRPYRSGADDAAWQRLNELGYRDSADYSFLTDDDLVTLRGEERFHLWLAGRDGDVVGLCHTKDVGGKGCVNSLVVEPSLRGRGLGRALLVAGIATLRDEDPGPVRLSVLADNAPALALYRSVGFGTDDEILTWWRRRCLD